MNPWSLLLVGAYGLALLVIGVALRRRGAGREGAWLAGRRLGAGILGVSLAATAIGGSATVVLARFVHAHGLPGLWLDAPVGLGFVIFGLFLAGRVRATGRFSLPDVAGGQYGPRFRRATAVLVVAAELGWFALLARAGAPFLAALTPLSPDAAVLVTACTFILYTVFGGQAAVVWTDSVQFTLAWGVGLVLPATVALVLTGGLAGLPAELASFPTGGSVDGLAVLGFLALTGLPGLVGGDLWSKTLSARDTGAARRGAVLAGALKLVGTAAVVVLALSAHLLLPDLPTGDDLLPRVLARVLPEPLVALTALAFLAAMMSSGDSVLLTAATVVDVDLLPGPGGRWRPRAVLLALGAAGVALSLAVGSVVELMLWAYTIFAAGAPLPILLGFLRRRPPEWAATAALTAGGATAVAAKLAGVTRPEPVLLGLAASAACLLVGAIVAWAGGRRR
jgi:SSS family solute:Na+ symporter